MKPRDEDAYGIVVTNAVGRTLRIPARHASALFDVLARWVRHPATRDVHVYPTARERYAYPPPGPRPR